MATFSRLLLAAILLLSGTMKLRDPALFAHALVSFRLGFSEAFVERSALLLPWLELTVGGALLLGWKARGAALLSLALMLAFAGGILSLMARGLDVDCPCFGQLKLICSGPLGVCHLVRNTVLGALSVIVLMKGPGRFALGAPSRASRTALNHPLA